MINSSPQTPIKSLEEFKKFVKTELSSDIEQTETARQSIKTPKMIYLSIGVMIVVVYLIYRLTNTGNSFSMGSQLPILIITAVVFFVVFFFMRTKISKVAKTALFESEAGSDFKMKVLNKIVKFTDANAQYAMHGHIGLEDFIQSGLFIEKAYEITGNDLIIGRHSGVPYQLSDLTVRYKRNFTDVRESPDTVFYGQFFVAGFNKSFSSSIFITPNANNTKNKGNYYEIDSYVNTSDKGEKVMLEDPEFMNMFEVYANDQIEARYILTTSMMERIKSLSQRMGGKLYISFKDNCIAICSHSCRDNFELNVSSSLTDNDYQMIEQFYDQLTSQLSIIEYLNLNIKIWR